MNQEGGDELTSSVIMAILARYSCSNYGDDGESIMDFPYHTSPHLVGLTRF